MWSMIFVSFVHGSESIETTFVLLWNSRIQNARQKALTRVNNGKWKNFGGKWKIVIAFYALLCFITLRALHRCFCAIYNSSHTSISFSTFIYIVEVHVLRPTSWNGWNTQRTLHIEHNHCTYRAFTHQHHLTTLIMDCI